MFGHPLFSPNCRQPLLPLYLSLKSLLTFSPVAPKKKDVLPMKWQMGRIRACVSEKGEYFSYYSTAPGVQFISGSDAPPPPLPSRMHGEIGAIKNHTSESERISCNCRSSEGHPATSGHGSNVCDRQSLMVLVMLPEFLFQRRENFLASLFQPKRGDLAAVEHTQPQKQTDRPVGHCPPPPPLLLHHPIHFFGILPLRFTVNPSQSLVLSFTRHTQQRQPPKQRV